MLLIISLHLSVIPCILRPANVLICLTGISMSCTGFSYQKLRNELSDNEKESIQLKGRSRWPLRLKKVHMRKRLKLRKFMRRKARVIMASLRKVMKRLKESQAHFGDLFAGNYLFLQVNPTALKSPSSHKCYVY